MCLKTTETLLGIETANWLLLILEIVVVSKLLKPF